MRYKNLGRAKEKFKAILSHMYEGEDLEKKTDQVIQWFETNQREITDKEFDELMRRE